MKVDFAEHYCDRHCYYMCFFVEQLRPPLPLPKILFYSSDHMFSYNVAVAAWMYNRVSSIFLIQCLMYSFRPLINLKVWLSSLRCWRWLSPKDARFELPWRGLVVVVCSRSSRHISAVMWGHKWILRIGDFIWRCIWLTKWTSGGWLRIITVIQISALQATVTWWWLGDHAKRHNHTSF